MLTHAGLFSGIGGFSLAAEWMGWQNVFEVELDPFCRQVLHKNFPNSQLFEDVCTFDGLPFRGRIDILSGGFPCQPFSAAGKGLGTADPRALWPQMRRVISEVQPRFVVGENVRGLLSNGGGLAFDAVCTDLEAEGYEVLPFLLPACAVGAPHRRDRFWFVAHARRIAWDGRQSKDLGDELNGQDAQRLESPSEHQGLCQAGPVSNADCERCQAGRGGGANECTGLPLPSRLDTERPANGGAAIGYRQDASDAEGQRRQKLASLSLATGQKRSTDSGSHGYQNGTDFRLTEPALCSPDDGLSTRLVRARRPLASGHYSPRSKQLKAYGNAIVPQVAYQIFQAIQLTLNS